MALLSIHGSNMTLMATASLNSSYYWVGAPSVGAYDYGATPTS
jgi:hypothetical protein